MINIIFNFVLIPELSITGAALSTMITYFSMFLIIYFYSQKIYKIEYDWNKIAGLSFLTAAAFVIGYFVVNETDQNLFVKIILNLSIIGFYLFVINYFKIIELKKINILWKK